MLDIKAYRRFDNEHRNLIRIEFSEKPDDKTKFRPYSVSLTLPSDINVSKWQNQLNFRFCLNK